MKNNRLKKAIIAVFVAVILCINGGTYTVLATEISETHNENISNDEVIPNDETGIPDKVVYQKIQSMFPGKVITKERLGKVKNLIIDKKVGSLKGIEFLTNCRILSVSRFRDSEISSLEGIEKLTKLWCLEIMNSCLTDISPLKGLTQLKELELSGNKCKIKDWSPLKNLKNLEVLTIENMGLNDRDLKKIAANLPQLKRLYISKNKFNTLRPLKSQKKLKYLEAEKCNLTSLNGIEKMTKLRSLYVRNNKLEKLPNMRKLYFYDSLFDHNKISRKEFLKCMPKGIVKYDIYHINKQVALQDTEKKLIINTPKKLKSSTKSIGGKTEKWATKAVLKNSKGKVIKQAKIDDKGEFYFKDLNLTKFKGKTIRMKILYKYIDIEGNTPSWVPVKKIDFAVR